MDLEIPSRASIKKAIDAMYPMRPRPKDIKHVARQLTAKEQALWQAVVDTARGGVGGLVPEVPEEAPKKKKA